MEYVSTRTVKEPTIQSEIHFYYSWQTLKFDYFELIEGVSMILVSSIEQT